MTLTAIMPTLRGTIPDPVDVNAWPAGCQVTTTDVIVCGVSMTRLVEICQTPCLHTAAAVIPGTHGRPAPHRSAAVVVVRVTAVLRNFDAARVVLIDASLDTVNPSWREARLIGRASRVKRTTAVLLSGESHETPSIGRGVAELPDDLREGDLIALPCPGALALRDIRARPPVRISAPSQLERDTAEVSWLGQLA